jgi:hypothetical protein
VTTRSITTGDVQFRVLIQIGDASVVPQVGLWGSALWGTNVWGVSGDAYMKDVTDFCEGFSTVNGRQNYTTRFRAGRAVIDLDNTGGEWTPSGGAPLPGFLPLRPGRIVQIFSSTPGTTEVQLYEGFVDTIQDRYGKDGNLITRIRALDLLGFNAPVANTVEQPSQGAGESYVARMRRIVAHEFTPEPNVEFFGSSADDGAGSVSSGTDMAATTLAADALFLLQITADSEGGGVWMHPTGALRASLFNYFTDRAEGPPDWVVGQGPIQVFTIDDADWSAQRIVNEGHYARAGGTEQVASNVDSRGLYGRRTHRRLDLQNSTDDRPATLAQRIVTNLANDRAQITGMTLQPSNTDEYLMGALAEFGDVVLLTVRTIYGWSYTLKTQIFGIAHSVTPEEWLVSLILDDSEIEDKGAFSSGFSDGYDV